MLLRSLKLAQLLWKGSTREFVEPFIPQGSTRVLASKANLISRLTVSITLCLSYGKAGHPRAQFKFRNYTSHSHSKNGQITGACNSEKVHKIGRTELPEVSLSESVDLFSFSLYNVNLGRHGIEVSVELNGTPLLMERDTSVSVFLISQETYRQHFKGTILRPSSIHLHIHKGHPVIDKLMYTLCSKIRVLMLPCPTMLYCK